VGVHCPYLHKPYNWGKSQADTKSIIMSIQIHKNSPTSPFVVFWCRIKTSYLNFWPKCLFAQQSVTILFETFFFFRFSQKQENWDTRFWYDNIDLSV
jgi:hypothetical protein